MRALVFLSLAVILTLPQITAASTVVRSGETVAISSDQVVEGDFYGLGGTVALSGKVSEDLLLLGGTVTMNGEVGADIAVLGGTVDIHGLVNDDVRVVGGSVTIAGEITGNLVVVASDLKVLSTAKIGGDILFFGAKGDISGAVAGDILGTSEYLRVDAPVGGGLDVKTRSLVLGERAAVTENVSYTSMVELTRSQNSIVKGDVVRSEAVVVAPNEFKNALVPFLITLFAALVFQLLFKRFTMRVVESAQTHQFRAVLIGFGVIFLIPIAAMILLISTLGSLLGVLLLALYFVFLTLMLFLMGCVAGAYVMPLFRQPAEVSMLSIVVGVALVHLLMYIPVIGPILVIPLAVLTIGVIAERVYLLFRTI